VPAKQRGNEPWTLLVPAVVENADAVERAHGLDQVGEAVAVDVANQFWRRRMSAAETAGNDRKTFVSTSSVATKIISAQKPWACAARACSTGTNVRNVDSTAKPWCPRMWSRMKASHSRAAEDRIAGEMPRYEPPFNSAQRSSTLNQSRPLRRTGNNSLLPLPGGPARPTIRGW
jgi:hypothetical protein